MAKKKKAKGSKSEPVVESRPWGSDDNWLSFRRILKNCQAVQTEDLTKEVENLHSSRSVRGLKGDGSSSIKKLTRACAEDQSYRSRLVEIKIVCSKEFNHLKMAHDSIRDYLNSSFSNKLGLKSQAERDAHWRATLAKSHKRLAELEDCIEIADMVIEDVDKAAWALRNMMDALNVVSKGVY